MNILMWFFCLLEVICFVYLDKKLIVNKYISPMIFIAFPFLLISIFAIMTGEFLGYVSLQPRFFLIWFIGLLGIHIGGLFCYLLNGKKKKSIQIFYLENNTKNKKKYYFLSFINIISSALIILRAFIIINSNIINLLTKMDFPNLLGSGIYGYLRIIVIISTTFLICTFDFKKFSFCEFASLILGMFCLVLYRIKGIILIPILAGIIYKYIHNKEKIPVKKLLFSGIFILAVFYLAYSVPYIMNGNFNSIKGAEFNNLVINKVAMYLYAGALAYGEFITKSVTVSEPWYILISPVYNVICRFTGWEKVKPLTSYFMLIGESETSNVFTIFGTIEIFSNLFVVFIFAFIIGILSYGALNLMLLYPKNIWFKVGYAVLMYYFLMGMFDYFFYYAYILIMFVIIYSIAFAACFVKKNWRKIRWKL